MATQVRLFISAGPAEEPAREIVGRSLAELPVNVGWTIKRTPDIDAVAECHLFMLILGADITAPVGLELWWAQRTEKPVLAYSAETVRTPAGHVFWQENAHLDWHPFATPAGLRRATLADLGRFLLAHSDRYGVTIMERETLRGVLAGLEKTQPPAAGAPGKAGGAAGGGVILAPGKDRPAGAQVLGEE
ncbi:MAG TPA: hypothetical protein VGA61_10020 [Anaerolineae bacterium]